MLKRVLWVVVPVSALLGVIVLMILATGSASMPVIDTRGSVGNAERDTLFAAVAVMLVVVIPVFILTFFISFRYRETNKKARYTPDWASSKKLETIWWGVPIAIIAVLSVITWQTSHSLDPFKPLSSDKPALQVQVVALQWKWLFIYPQYGVASVGEFALPVNTPVAFSITSDAPMNSFWIPQLGGQIYAMAGMSTKLHLDANKTGDYKGVSANLSGEGHSSMTFVAKARNDADFASWIAAAKKSQQLLDASTYEQLRMPSKFEKVQYYQTDSTDLYGAVVKRYSMSQMTVQKENALPGELE